MNLQPLKIPAGWTVNWNLFTETEPTEASIHEFTGSSLLYLSSATRLKAIDVSWQPEGDINGNFQLEVINLLPKFNTKTNEMEHIGDWEHPTDIFRTKSRHELVSKINDLLFYLKPYKDERIMLKPGIVDKDNEATRQTLLTKGVTENVIKQILSSDSKQLQSLLLDKSNIDKKIVMFLSENGCSKGVKNKARQLLNSKTYKNHF